MDNEEVARRVNEHQHRPDVFPVTCQSDGEVMSCVVSKTDRALFLVCGKCGSKVAVPHDLIETLTDPRRILYVKVKAMPLCGWTREQLAKEYFDLSWYLYQNGLSIDKIEYVMSNAYRIVASDNGSEV